MYTLTRQGGQRRDFRLGGHKRRHDKVACRAGPKESRADYTNKLHYAKGFENERRIAGRWRRKGTTIVANQNRKVKESGIASLGVPDEIVAANGRQVVEQA